MSTNPTAIKTHVFLNSPKDWDEWIMLLEFAALKNDVWKYVNPATPKSDLPRLTEPIRPTPSFVQSLRLNRPYRATPAPDSIVSDTPTSEA
jgi:hypothetical protein